MRILVTGATGMLGRAVVSTLTSSEHQVRALSRSQRAEPPGVDWITGDLTTGKGIERALDGVDAVIHLASAPYRRSYTEQVELDGTRFLLSAAEKAGVEHLLYTSIIGCDRIPWGYFRTKVAAERLIQDGPVRWSILRSAQFFDFVDQAFSAMARFRIIGTDRRITAQPVDVSDVAGRIIQSMESGPSSGIAEFAGPDVLDLESAAREWLRITGRKAYVLRTKLPGATAAAFRSGYLTTPALPTGSVTWQSYLQRTYAPRS